MTPVRPCLFWFSANKFTYAPHECPLTQVGKMGKGLSDSIATSTSILAPVRDSLTREITLVLLLLCCCANAIPLAQFYPYGSEAGDKGLFRNDDGSSLVINLTTSFPFFNRDHSTLFVSQYASI